VEGVCAKADEISSPHHCFTISPHSEVKPIFLLNCYTKFYKPGVISEAPNNAKRMVVRLSG
jgi:hypothetical protein